MDMGSKAMKRTALAGTVLVIALTFAACVQSVKIGTLLADPARYSNRAVQIHGTVQGSEGFLGTGVYSLNDGTGTIWVLATGGVPGKGARVDSTGTISQGVSFFGRSFGVLFRERQHHIH